MALESADRDILIEVKTKVDAIHARLPKLEDTVADHDKQLNQIAGGRVVTLWFLGIIGAVVLALGTVLVGHMLGGK